MSMQSVQNFQSINPGIIIENDLIYCKCRYPSQPVKQECAILEHWQKHHADLSCPYIEKLKAKYKEPKCPYCNRSFVNHDSLFKHCRRTHVAANSEKEDNEVVMAANSLMSLYWFRYFA